MKNLTIANAPPAKPAQPPTQLDSGVAREAEPFGSVLARQCASQESADSGQATPSPAGGASATTGNGENPDDARAHVPDVNVAMLAALLPVADRMSDIAAANEKVDLPEYAADGEGVLPGDMLAAPLQATAIRQDTAPLIPGVNGGSSGTQSATSPLFRAQGYSGIAPVDTQSDTIGSDAFRAVSGTPGKGVDTLEQSPAGARILAQAAQLDATVPVALPQNGATSNAAGLNGAAQISLSIPLTNNAWGDEFSQRITWMVTQHAQTAELHLNPPNLGPLDVVLSVSGDQATALFTSPHAAVRSAVEQALPKLREMLADNGIMLGNATVSDQPPRERQAGPGSQQKGGDWHTIPVGGVQVGLTAWPGRRHEGMVDIFA